MVVGTMFKLCLLMSLSAVAYVYAAVAIYPYEPKPAEFADQEGCYIADLKRVLPYNKPYYPGNGQCLQYTCGTNNETQLVSCGVYGFPGNCRLVKNLTLNYPDCCGTVVCDPTTETPVETPSTETPSTETPSTDTPSTVTDEETCVTVTEPPCDRPWPRRPKYTLPVEKPVC